MRGYEDLRFRLRAATNELVALILGNPDSVRACLQLTSLEGILSSIDTAVRSSSLIRTAIDFGELSHLALDSGLLDADELSELYERYDIPYDTKLEQAQLRGAELNGLH